MFETNFKRKVLVTENATGKVLSLDEVLNVVNRAQPVRWSRYKYNDLMINPKQVTDHLDLSVYSVELDTFEENEVVDMPSGLGGVLPALVLKKYDDGTCHVRCIHDEFYPLYLIKVELHKLTKHDGYLTDGSKKLLVKARSPDCGLN